MKLRSLFATAEFHQGLDSLREVLQKYESIAKSSDIYHVVEDLMLAGAKSKELCEVFLAFTHHLPICATFYTVQSLYQKNSNLGMIMRNATNIIFTGSKRLKSSLATFGRELEPCSPMDLLKVFEKCLHNPVSTKFPYLVVNCLAQDIGMYYTGIFPAETLQVFRPECIESHME